MKAQRGEHLQMDQVIEEKKGNGHDANKRELNLSHRELRELDAALIATYSACIIEYLDVSHNRLTRLEWIWQFPHLRCLVMDDNRLREAHLEKLKIPLPKITTLTLNKNELSDLDTTARILQQTFPNLEYLSLHGNPMCPDNLCLQPFSEFVPYEYKHYRTILKKSLPHLKFLDHFSLESPHSNNQISCQVNHDSKQQQQQHSTDEQLHSTAKDLWSKLKSFLNNDSSTSNANTSTLPTSTARSSCDKACAPCSDSTYQGIHSEGNRFITNSEL